MIENVAEGVQAFTSNVFLVTGERTVVIDPGSNFDLPARLRERTDDVDAVVLTHAHPDHVENVPDVVDAYDVEVFGFDAGNDLVDRAIADEESVRLGDHDYVALHTPGHADDHLCLYSPDASVLFAGDLVFQNGSFGRTDFEEGDRSTLIESVDRLLDRVDPDLGEMHSGHGPSVTDDPYHHIELARRFAATA